MSQMGRFQSDFALLRHTLCTSHPKGIKATRRWIWNPAVAMVSAVSRERSLGKFGCAERTNEGVSVSQTWDSATRERFENEILALGGIKGIGEEMQPHADFPRENSHDSS